MPSLYTSTQAMESSLWDGLFKAIVSGGWGNEGDGNVESPVGYYCIIEMCEPDLRPNTLGNLRHTFEDDWPNTEANLRPGWYITVETDQGFIYVYWFATEAAARAEYSMRELEYSNWLASSDEEDV